MLTTLLKESYLWQNTFIINSQVNWRSNKTFHMHSCLFYHLASKFIFDADGKAGFQTTLLTIRALLQVHFLTLYKKHLCVQPWESTWLQGLRLSIKRASDLSESLPLYCSSLLDLSLFPLLLILGFPIYPMRYSERISLTSFLCRKFLGRPEKHFNELITLSPSSKTNTE